MAPLNNLSSTPSTQEWDSQHRLRIERPEVYRCYSLRSSIAEELPSHHPLSHLMQAVFGLHDPTKCRVFVYATGNESDDSPSRRRIESQSANFVDMSSCSSSDIVARIIQDQIHICSCARCLLGTTADLAL
jgi:predicted O-linked N-acetylglucosamine transferase (SPINDLY family)